MDSTAEIKILDDLLLDLYSQQEIVKSSIQKAENRKKALTSVSTEVNQIISPAVLKARKDDAKRTAKHYNHAS